MGHRYPGVRRHRADHQLMKELVQPSRKLFLGLPTYCGQRYNLMPIIAAITYGQERFETIITSESEQSALCTGFNRLLCQALDLRDQGECTHFLLMHADIVPLGRDWLIKLIDEFEFAKAEVMGAISPIKDGRGVTSVGIETDNPYGPRRITIKELLKNPTTFTDPKLVLNTGLMLMDLRNKWVDKIAFNFKDTILRGVDDKGRITRQAAMQPEDWDISRQMRDLGVTLWATQAVKLLHIGRYDYPSWGGWGAEESDPSDEAPVSIDAKHAKLNPFDPPKVL